ncbi:protein DETOXIFICATION 14-like [Lycium ferocissimum]|uniref:protein DETOXIFICATION 14-like n=1 Tax=Lycium ferocissimum TaxID=112874 RepID=UPI002815549F|nr:protein DETOXIFICATION 14-like [Lycium ferocissimum]
MASHLEEGLLVKERLDGNNNKEENNNSVEVLRRENTVGWEVIWVEMKRIGYLAGPMAAVTLSQYLLQVISMMMVGHLGQLYLSSTAIAVSLATVTGLTLLLGMASALETLCGQAYGAKQYKKIGTQTYTAIFCLFIVCVPLSMLWIYVGRLLVFMGQDPQISYEAGRFIMCLIPTLFGSAALQPLIRYYLMQSMILPLIISSCLTIVVHVPLCWVLVYHTGLKNIGAAFAMDISIWLNVTILASYMRFSPACEKTRVPISSEILHGTKDFFRFAIPSAIMICLEGWSFELIILLSGLLPNPEVETSVLSVCLNTIATLYSIPYGLSGAVSTRVSNELGAGNPQGACISVFSVMLLTVMEAILVSATLFGCRNIFGFLFSSDVAVVNYVAKIAPLVSLSVIMDALQASLSGVARGCGWQHIGAYVNLASFYLFGIPIAVALSFWLELRGEGLWIGILCGATLQTILLSVITSLTNWKKQAAMARERFLEVK